MGDDCCNSKADEVAKLATAGRRRVLWIVLAINAAMFFIEFGAGVVARSTALMADSVDMLGDALVYVLSLIALNRGPRWQAGAALAKGGFILLLGVAVIIEAVIKLVTGAEPVSGMMAGFGTLALVANLFCLALLWRFRHADVNMSSTYECSRNDVISNVGVLIAAGAVWWTGQAWPDIAVGAIVAILFLRSAFVVVWRAWPQFRTSRATGPSPLEDAH